MKGSDLWVNLPKPKQLSKWHYSLVIFKLWWNKVNPFNYRVFIYNKRTLSHVNSAAKIGYDGKYLFLLQHDGTPFKAQTAITLIDSVNEPTCAKVELFVNLDDIIKINNGHESRK